MTLYLLILIIYLVILLPNKIEKVYRHNEFPQLGCFERKREGKLGETFLAGAQNVFSPNWRDNCWGNFRSSEMHSKWAPHFSFPPTFLSLHFPFLSYLLSTTFSLPTSKQTLLVVFVSIFFIIILFKAFEVEVTSLLQHVTHVCVNKGKKDTQSFK